MSSVDRRHLHPVKRKAGGIEDVRDAWAVMAAGAPAVAAELVRIAQEADSEFVRVQAATAVLDRVGLGKVDGHVVRMVGEDGGTDGTAGRSAASIVAARLAALEAPVGPVDATTSLAEEGWDMEFLPDPEPVEDD